MKKMSLTTTIQTSLILVAGVVSPLASAEDFDFDRPGTGFGVSVVPKGHVAWEQALPSVSYDDHYKNGSKQSTLTVQGDMLARIGVGADTEVRIGWDGPMWQRQKNGSQKDTVDGVGDVTLGVKKAIDLGDDRLKWAVLGEINLANGDDEFTVDKKIYTLGSSLTYRFNDLIDTGMTMYYDYQDKDLAWTAVPTISYKINDKFSGFAEYVYRRKESQEFQSSVNNGVIWSIRNNLKLDASMGYSFHGDQPRFTAGLGASYLF